MTDQMNQLITRINQIARKAKSQGLTETEIIERNKLRQEYLKFFRKSMKMQLDAIEFTDDNKKNK